MVFCVLIVAAAFFLGPVRRVEPFYTYFYLWAWLPFIEGLIATLRRRTPPSPLLAPRALLGLSLFSTTYWLVFEALNLRLQNWTYHGVPALTPVRWAGYAMSFATVAPALLLLAELFRPARAPEAPAARASATGFPTASVVAGTLMLILPLAFPRYFFPLVWGFSFFLTDPFVERLGGHSLMADWRARRFGPTKALLLSGLVCGGYWEMCNFWAGAKWKYHIPFVGDLKLFEMPVLGFLGFPPFALEVYSATQLTTLLLARRPLPPWARAAMVTAMVVFWAAVFAGIDGGTVKDYR